MAKLEQYPLLKVRFIIGGIMASKLCRLCLFLWLSLATSSLAEVPFPLLELKINQNLNQLILRKEAALVDKYVELSRIFYRQDLSTINLIFHARAEDFAYLCQGIDARQDFSYLRFLEGIKNIQCHPDGTISGDASGKDQPSQ